jgi:hypothetical protein
MNKPRKSPRTRKTKAKNPRKRTARTHTSSPPSSSVFNLKIEEIEKRLASGKVDAELELYFGPQLPDLQQLARSASARMRGPAAARPKVLVLPGIMGSTLGYKRPDPLDLPRYFVGGSARHGDRPPAAPWHSLS